jgi:hypothetical protein
MCPGGRKSRHAGKRRRAGAKAQQPGQRFALKKREGKNVWGDVWGKAKTRRPPKSLKTNGYSFPFRTSYRE